MTLWRRIRGVVNQLRRTCHCRGQHRYWAYHSAEGCGRDARRYESARERDLKPWSGGSS